MTKINKTYITGTVVTRKRFIDGQGDVARRFMKGFLEGMKTYLEDEEFSIKVIQKWTRSKNREEIKEAYALQARHMLRVPRTSLEGVKTILEGMDRIPGAKTADPRRFVDSSVLDELEKEGFFKTLYKNRFTSARTGSSAIKKGIGRKRCVLNCPGSASCTQTGALSLSELRIL